MSESCGACDGTGEIDGNICRICHGLKVEQSFTPDGFLTDDQIAEVMRLASLLATARVLRYRVNSNSLGTADPKKAAVHVRDCEQNLRHYLESL